MFLPLDAGKVMPPQGAVFFAPARVLVTKGEEDVHVIVGLAFTCSSWRCPMER